MLKANSGPSGRPAGAGIGANRPAAGVAANRPATGAGIGANRPAAGAARTVQTQAAHVVEAAVVETQTAAPAVIQQNAVATTGNQTSIAEMNAGILEGLEGIGESNRVGIDGTEFEYKNRERRERDLYIVINYGRRVYQYWDDNSTLCQSFDGKTSTDGLVCATCEFKRNKSCKFKFELRWLEPNQDDPDQPEEFIITLPTVSAVRFVEYVKALTKEGLAINQVVTHMAIERLQKDNNKYSAIIFESAGMAE